MSYKAVDCLLRYHQSVIIIRQANGVRIVSELESMVWRDNTRITLYSSWLGIPLENWILHRQLSYWVIDTDLQIYNTLTYIYHRSHLAWCLATRGWNLMTWKTPTGRRKWGSCGALHSDVFGSGNHRNTVCTHSGILSSQSTLNVDRPWSEVAKHGHSSGIWQAYMKS